MVPEFKLCENSVIPLCEWFHTDKEHVWMVLSQWNENVAIVIDSSLIHSSIVHKLEEIQKKNGYIYVRRDSN